MLKIVAWFSRVSGFVAKSTEFTSRKIYLNTCQRILIVYIKEGKMSSSQNVTKTSFSG
jgi:hypothetical protein